MRKILLLILMNFTALAQIEPEAGKWKPWVLHTAADFRPAAPPSGAAEREELDWLKSFMASRNAASDEQVRYWDSGAPGYRWLQLLINRLRRQSLGNPGNTRALALLNVAVYDATLAAWDAKYAHGRHNPSHADPNLRPLVAVDDTPSYPSEHAATAGAAAAVLAYLYPSDGKFYEDLAQEAGRSRLFSGANYPSDVVAGMELGRKVAARVIERAASDGSTAVWTGTVPAGPGKWTGANPISPLHGTWQPWVLESGSQFRPEPPPAYNSAQKIAELAEIKDFVRTFDTNAGAMFWQTFDGIFSYWYDLATQRIFESHLDRNPPRAARVYALASVTHADASIACWDAKYTYWAIRPFQLDSGVTTLFATPNHPSYPAAHGCYSGGIARALATLFPSDSDYLDGKATVAAESRIAAGIHFRSDVEAGLTLGRSVAGTVMKRAAQDGSGGSRAE